MSKDPIRRLDDAGYPEGRRDLLRAGLDVSPPPGAKDEVWRSLGAAIGPAAPAAPGVRAPARSLPARKLAAYGLTAAAIVGAAGVLLWRASAGDRRADEPEIRSSAPATVPVPTPPITPPSEAAVPQVIPPEPEPPAARRPARRSPAAHAGAPARAPEAPAPSAPPAAVPETGPVAEETPPAASRRASRLREEVALVRRARQTLRSGDPAGALRILDAGAREFPDGVLGQERERLAIQALVAAGRHDDAVTRADAFLRRYPGSPHAEEIRALAH